MAELTDKEKIIKEVYEDKEKGFGSIKETFKEAVKKDPSIKYKDVKEYLDKIPSRQTQFKYKGFNSFISPHPLFEFELDIIDMGASIEKKDGIRYGLVAIDNFTKFAWAIPMKEKNTANLKEALTEIIYKMGQPKQTYMDIEGSTTSNDFINWITNTKKIKHVTTATHAHTVERFNRTLKENMVKRLDYENKGREKWTEQLNYVLNKYNNTIHSTIEMTPIQAKKKSNEMVVKFNLWNNAKRNRKYPELNEGSNVRTIQKQDGKKKGYDPKWSKQVYKVIRVDGLNYTIDETNPSKKKTFNRYELLKV